MRKKEEAAPLLYRAKNKFGFYTNKGNVKKEAVSAVDNTFSDENLIQYIASHLTISSLLHFRQVNREIYSAIMATYADNVIALYRCHPNFKKTNFNPRDIDIEANNSAPALFIDANQSLYTIAQLLFRLQEHQKIEQKIPKIKHIATAEREAAEILAQCGKTRECVKGITLFTILTGAIVGSGAGWAYSALFGSYIYLSIFFGSLAGEIFCLGVTLGCLYGLPSCLTLLSELSKEQAAQLSSALDADLRPLVDAIKRAVENDLQAQYVLSEEEVESSDEEKESYYTP